MVAIKVNYAALLKPLFRGIKEGLDEPLAFAKNSYDSFAVKLKNVFNRNLDEPVAIDETATNAGNKPDEETVIDVRDISDCAKDESCSNFFENAYDYVTTHLIMTVLITITVIILIKKFRYGKSA